MAANMRWGRRGGSSTERITANGLRDLVRSAAVGMPFQPGESPGIKAFQGSYLATKKRHSLASKSGRLDWPRPDGRNAVDEPEPTRVRNVKPRGY
jgi:hypothetical protein